MTGNFNAGGNEVLGNTTASANLTLESTTNATKGFVNIQPNGGNVRIGTLNAATKTPNVASAALSLMVYQNGHVFHNPFNCASASNAPLIGANCIRSAWADFSSNCVQQYRRPAIKRLQCISGDGSRRQQRQYRAAHRYLTLTGYVTPSAIKKAEMGATTESRK